MANIDIISWNVNGLRACVRKGFMDWLSQDPGDIICLQEVRAREEQLTPEVKAPQNWNTHFVAAEKRGYSGVGVFSRKAWDDMNTLTGIKKFDAEGRLQFMRFGELTIVNGYFPNGSGRNRDNSRIPYKLDFYKKVFRMLNKDFKAGKPILVLGDLNTAHEEIDLARPKSNHETSGFRAEERNEFSRWIEAGWVDTFRHFYPNENGHYTWWSNRQGVRERNIGWRIDYVLASPGAMPFVKDADIYPGDMGSDHCPIGVTVDNQIFSVKG